MEGDREQQGRAMQGETTPDILDSHTQPQGAVVPELLDYLQCPV
jgi:hypothetical protein